MIAITRITIRQPVALLRQIRPLVLFISYPMADSSVDPRQGVNSGRKKIMGAMRTPVRIIVHYGDLLIFAPVTFE
jgi:hypothetical protein